MRVGRHEQVAEYSDGSEAAWIRSTRTRTADLRERETKVGRSSSYRLTMARSGTDTSVVAVIRSQNDETITECWWLDLLSTGSQSVVRATDDENASTTEEPRVVQLKPPQPSADQQAKTRAKRSRATSQHEDRGQQDEKNETGSAVLRDWSARCSEAARPPGWCAEFTCHVEFRRTAVLRRSEESLSLRPIMAD